jgi:hypothetical protein
MRKKETHNSGSEKISNVQRVQGKSVIMPTFLKISHKTGMQSKIRVEHQNCEKNTDMRLQS